jgi:hypothetical protein
MLNFAEMRSGPTPQPKKPGEVKAPKDPKAPGPEEEVLEEEETGEVASVMGDLAPWAMSILIHAAMVLIAVLWVWATIKQQPEEEEPIIPIARLSEKPGAPLTMKTTTQPTKTSASKRSVTKSEKQTEKVASKVKADSSLIGVAGGSDSKASPFGTAAVGTGGPFKAGFFGSGGNAKKIAYIIDASGSLIDTLPFVMSELKRSINGLSEQQSFTVVFFGENGKVSEVPPPGLKPITSDTRTNAFKWMDSDEGNVIPGGQASHGPLEALKKVLSYKPDLVFLLSDNITGQGRYEITQATLRTEIKNANKNKTKINTIQFMYPDPLIKIPGMRATLDMISQDSGGLHKYVSGKELGISNN